MGETYFPSGGSSKGDETYFSIFLDNNGANILMVLPSQNRAPSIATTNTNVSKWVGVWSKCYLFLSAERVHVNSMTGAGIWQISLRLMSKMNQSGSTNGFLPANSFIESLGFEESTNDVAFILDVSVTLFKELFQSVKGEQNYTELIVYDML